MVGRSSRSAHAIDRPQSSICTRRARSSLIRWDPLVLGQFDRPFFPEQPIFGTVRPRPLAVHESRTNLAAYTKKVDRPVASPSPRVAMIGTGLAGLICSRTLQDQGLQVKCFEKSHRAGGRASTRIADGKLQFDHGAQYFTFATQS